MSKRTTGILLLVLLGAVGVFHLLVLFQLIPYTAVWGGKISSARQMYVFETISLTINMILIVTVLQHIGLTQRFWPEKIIRLILWLFVVLFSLNTLGNLFAENRYEQIFGTFFTLLAAFLCRRLLHTNSRS